MTLKEILDLKDLGYSLDEIEKINNILSNSEHVQTGDASDDPVPEPESDSSDPEATGNDKPSDDDQPTSDDQDYKQMYEELKEKMEKDAANKDLSGDDEKQVEIQDAIAAFFKTKFG